MLDLDEAIRMRHSTRMFFRAEEYDARQRAIKAALERLDQLSQECRFWTEVVEGLRAQYQDRHSGDSDTRHRELGEVHDEIELALIETERNEIDQLFRKGMRARGADQAGVWAHPPASTRSERRIRKP